MVILGVDLGRARTGLAICDKAEMLAVPVSVLEKRRADELADAIAHICTERKVEMIVLGLPKNMDGSEGESAQFAREMGQLLEKRIGVQVCFMDERNTTVTAHGYLNNTNTRGKKRKAVVDAVAATVILEDFLRARRNKAM